MKARLYIDVKFSKRATDAESLASALDNVLDVGMAQLSDTWDEYGGKPTVGKFVALDTAKALEHANALDMLIDGEATSWARCSSQSGTSSGRSPGQNTEIGQAA
jgi:hypothetical protein